MKPYWPGDFVTTASDSEGHGGSEKLKVETLPSSEPPWDKLSLLEERPKENGDGQGTYKDNMLACLPNPHAQPHRGNACRAGAEAGGIEIKGTVNQRIGGGYKNSNARNQ